MSLLHPTEPAAFPNLWPEPFPRPQGCFFQNHKPFPNCVCVFSKTVHKWAMPSLSLFQGHRDVFSKITLCVVAFSKTEAKLFPKHSANCVIPCHNLFQGLRKEIFSKTCRKPQIAGAFCFFQGMASHLGLLFPKHNVTLLLSMPVQPATQSLFQGHMCKTRKQSFPRPAALSQGESTFSKGFRQGPRYARIHGRLEATILLSQIAQQSFSVACRANRNRLQLQVPNCSHHHKGTKWLK